MDAGRLPLSELSLDGWVVFWRTLDFSGNSLRRHAQRPLGAPIYTLFCLIWKGAFPMSSSAVDFARQNYPRFLDELKALLSIPSISTLPEHKGDCRKAAEVLAQVKALESRLAATGKLPLNVRVLLEGEEEVGGEGIASFVASKPPELKADFALVSDTELFAPGLPTLCVGLRGMIYTELEVRSARSDLHSGMYGGAAPHSFVSLAQILAKLKHENGHILIPGFYDDIIPPSPEELAAWKSLPFDEEEYRAKEVGSKQLVGEKGYSVLERTWARPTVDVHGIPGGFVGAGAKTVIPAKATAKVSMRLVPGMTPTKAFALYKSYVEKIAPDGVDVEVRLIHSGDPCLIPVNNKYIQAATRALHEVWGKDTVFIRSGGSIPIVGDFDRHLGLPSVMMGFGLPDDNLHAPNEKFHLKNFSLGIESLIRFLEEAGS